MKTQINENLNLRNIFGKFATGVSIVSFVGEDNNPIGITVNSFTSVSLDPPIALWCVDKKSELCEILINKKNYVFNFLAENQTDLAIKLAEKDNHILNDIDCNIKEYGPILKDSLGWVACSKREIIEQGDHFIILGNVDKISPISDDRKPLVFWSGGFQNLS
jgi:flavin reductase (DIM6/NTAB) family NADH-FMN oxidoreductase RutF